MSKQPTSLSLGLSSILDKIGASEEIRRLHRHVASTRDIMCTLEYDLRSIGFTSYSFGSYCEGTTTLGLESDIDVLEANRMLPVCESVEDAPLFGNSLLIVREEETYPGYVKLWLVQHGVPMKADFYDLHIAAYDTNHSGNIYMKHMPESIMGYSERNGPADTYRYESGLSFDRVNAMASTFIPEVASSFLTRRRPYNWPSKGDIEIMSRLGCFYVGVGYPYSPDKTSEWRMSFSRQERMLMFSLNETQHKCYILLKIIKKEMIEAEIGKTISSYHCKTCLFHAIENTPAALWRPENLCQCVILCLGILHKWVYRRYCPNFFIREENMFDRQVIRANKTHLLRIIWSIIRDGYRFFLKLQTDRIGECLTQRGTYLEPVVRLNKAQYVCILLTRMIEAVIHTDPRKYKVNALGVQSREHHPALIDVTVLDWVANKSGIREHAEQDTRTSLSYLQPVLHLNLAKSLISLWFNATSREQSVHLTKAFDFHFGKTQDGYSIITTNLVLATVLYRVGKIDHCKKLLEQVEANFSSTITPMCVCQEKIFKSSVIDWKNINPDRLIFKSFLRNGNALCVQFVKSEIEIIPTALRYELFRSSDVPDALRVRQRDNWYDFAVVDARVYLHFLQYLVYTKLGMPVQKYAAVNKLRGTALSKEDLGRRDNLGHRETACNLLGWIYIQEGHYTEAMEWFLASWMIKPVHNAAKWHVRQLMARLLKGKVLNVMQR